jgi:type IV pilus assembly protein PilB
MEVGESLRDTIILGASAVELKKKAIDGGMITLRRSGLIKVRDQLTTIEEVLRETVG